MKMSRSIHRFGFLCLFLISFLTLGGAKGQGGGCIFAGPSSEAVGDSDSGGGDTGDTGDKSPPPPTPCVTNNNCEAGEFCSGKKECQKLAPGQALPCLTGSDAECPAGKQCVDHVCQLPIIPAGNAAPSLALIYNAVPLDAGVENIISLDKNANLALDVLAEDPDVQDILTLAYPTDKGTYTPSDVGGAQNKKEGVYHWNNIQEGTTLIFKVKDNAIPPHEKSFTVTVEIKEPPVKKAEGQTCSPTEVCQDGLICVTANGESTCTDGGVGDVCTKEEECKAELVCNGGFCKTPDPVLVEEGGTCEKTEQCKADLVCVDQKCAKNYLLCQNAANPTLPLLESPESFDARRQFFVDGSRGSDQSVDAPKNYGSAEHPYKTIGAVFGEITKRRSGGDSSLYTVYVFNGNYNESLTLPTNTKLYGGVETVSLQAPEAYCVRRLAFQNPLDGLASWGTVVTSPDGGPALSIAGLSDTAKSLVDGFTFIAANFKPNQSSSSAVVIDHASPRLFHNQILGQISQTAPMVEFQGVLIKDKAYPVLENNEIYGACSTSGSVSECKHPEKMTPLSSAIKVELSETQGTSVAVRKNLLWGGHGGLLAAGVYLKSKTNRAGLRLQDNTIYAGIAPATYGVYAEATLTGSDPQQGDSIPPPAGQFDLPPQGLAVENPMPQQGVQPPAVVNPDPLQNAAQQGQSQVNPLPQQGPQQKAGPDLGIQQNNPNQQVQTPQNGQNQTNQNLYNPNLNLNANPNLNFNPNLNQKKNVKKKTGFQSGLQPAVEVLKRLASSLWISEAYAGGQSDSIPDPDTQLPPPQNQQYEEVKDLDPNAQNPSSPPPVPRIVVYRNKIFGEGSAANGQGGEKYTGIFLKGLNMEYASYVSTNLIIALKAGPQGDAQEPALCTGINDQGGNVDFSFNTVDVGQNCSQLLLGHAFVLGPAVTEAPAIYNNILISHVCPIDTAVSDGSINNVANVHHNVVSQPQSSDVAGADMVGCLKWTAAYFQNEHIDQTTINSFFQATPPASIQKNYHLNALSKAVDNADNAVNPLKTLLEEGDALHDLDGKVRPSLSLKYDIGAYELDEVGEN